jgi:hypothetical protein
VEHPLLTSRTITIAQLAPTQFDGDQCLAVEAQDTPNLLQRLHLRLGGKMMQRSHRQDAVDAGIGNRKTRRVGPQDRCLAAASSFLQQSLRKIQSDGNTGDVTKCSQVTT